LDLFKGCSALKKPGRDGPAWVRLSLALLTFEVERRLHPVNDRLIDIGDVACMSCHFADPQVILRCFAPAMALGSANDFSNAMRSAVTRSAGTPGGASQPRPRIMLPAINSATFLSFGSVTRSFSKDTSERSVSGVWALTAITFTFSIQCGRAIFMPYQEDWKPLTSALFMAR
jgi:hypothetical protein